MNSSGVNKKEPFNKNTPDTSSREVNLLTNLPKASSFMLPKEFDLLPNASELFELEFAFYEYKSLTKDEIIHRGAFFKSVDGVLTYHYKICASNNPLIWEGRSEKTKAYFREGNFSTGYATHGLFPYRGKFHPQLIKGLLNLLKVQPGDVILDPMCGSGTLNVEASLIGINSIGIEKSPFCLLMSRVKYEALKVDDRIISLLQKNMEENYKSLKGSNRFYKESPCANELEPEKGITLLAFLDAMGYSRRCLKSIDILFPSVFKRYVAQIQSFIQDRDKLDLKIGDARFDIGDARSLALANNSIDAIITSPPYSFAIDYVENDKPQLEYLGYDPNKLKDDMIGLVGKNRKEKLANYFKDMNIVLSEMYRVLKPNRYSVIIIGSNDIQTGGIRLETKIEEMALTHGFALDQKILKPIKGIQNTMRDEYILFLRKAR
ncbi:MAG TPA: DNA methyltransferase [Candidatus Saccharicenans sp.]|nr:DNA methyltransferase [Candidatus Saccharicenans sp.]